MESLNSRLKNSGQTFETASDLRISKIKLNPNAFADYGQTIGTSSKKIGATGTCDQTRTSKFKPSLPEQRAKPSTGLHRQNVDKPKPQSEDELSEDEMDLLSEASRQSDFSSSQNLVSLSKKPKSQAVKPPLAGAQFPRRSGKPMEEENFVDKNGKKHQYDPKFPPVNQYANMSFKKTTAPKTEVSTGHPVLPLATSSSKKGESISKENSFLPQNGPSLWSPIRTDAPKSRAGKGKGKEIDLTSPTRGSWDDNEAAPLSPLSGKSANSNRTTSPPLRSSLPIPGRNTKNSDSSTDGMENLRKPPGKERPKPVPVRKGALKAAAEGGLAKFGYGNVANAVGTRSRPRQRSLSLEVSPPRRKEKSSMKLQPTLKPAPFPVTLDSIDFPFRPEVTDSNKDLPTPKPFPMLENPTGQRKLSGAQSKGKGTVRGRKIVISEDEDADDDEDGVDGDEVTRMVPKAFPMNISSIGSSPGSSRPSKRNSDYGSDDDRISKKSRMRVESLTGPSSRPFDDEGDSMSLDSGVQHEFLCPFCDTPLPAHPSPLLLKLLEETKKKARPDVRPSNKFGLRAPLAIYITTCQRHRFESKILPEAEKKGWPKTINWKKVGSRILKMKDFLQALIDDTGDDLKEVPSSPSEYEWEVKYGRNMTEKDKKMAKGPKASSIIWTELMEEIEKKGLRAVSGVHGQFASFERAQPGYYGELGAVIIYQTLYNMFPPTEMDPDLVSPLTPTEFIQRILVPEVALQLIIEDQNLKGENKIEDALQILRDSSSYGVAMFPEDGGEFGDSKRRGQEKMGEGDLIVMERARKRRKELKEEEEREEEERRRQEENEREAEKSKKAQKARKERQPSVAGSIEVTEPVPRPRPKPVPVAKSRAAIVLPPPAKGDRPESSGRFTRSRSRSTCNDGSDSEKDSGRRPTPEERRRSPSASEYSGPKTYRRSPSHDMARLSIYCGNSDSSTDALVNGEGRSRSKARSIAASSKEKGTSRKTIEVSDSDSIVDVLENAKTPLAKRQCPKYAMEEDDTPRPPQRAETPPLVRARKRLQSKQDNAVPPAKQSTRNVKKGDSFSWVLDSSDSEHRSW